MVELLRVENLAKRFGGIVATDDLTLSIPEGELHAVIGPNGAGKTTLIAQLSGQLSPNSGRIHFAEQRYYRDVDAIAQSSWPGALVSNHLAVSRPERARQHCAGRASPCRSFISLLAQCAPRAGTARSGASGPRARRLGRPCRSAGVRSQSRRTSPTRARDGARVADLACFCWTSPWQVLARKSRRAWCPFCATLKRS